MTPRPTQPPTREGGGVLVERFDGLHASEASGPASAIKGGGAGKATEPGAAGEALRDENSQLPDGLPSLGGGESERAAQCPFCPISAGHWRKKWKRERRLARVKPIKSMSVGGTASGPT